MNNVVFKVKFSTLTSVPGALVSMIQNCNREQNSIKSCNSEQISKKNKTKIQEKN